MDKNNSQYLDCPKCGEKIELTGALTGRIEKEISERYKAEYGAMLRKRETELKEAISREVREKSSTEMDALKKKLQDSEEEVKKLDRRANELSQKENELKAKELSLQEELQKKLKENEQKIKEAAAAESASKLEELQEEIAEKNRKIQEAFETEKNLRKKQRELEEKEREMELEIERKMDEERKNIIEKAAAEAENKFRFKNREKDEMLDRYKKQVEELSRKLEQGSQQLQGEVQELELEEFLRRKFPFDLIKEVPKGMRGADVLQIVRDNTGRECGKIIWESKRTKNWSPDWIAKLKTDQREIKAEFPVIVSQALPEGVSQVGLVEGVWVIGFEATEGMATALREQLIQVASVKNSQVGMNRKMDAIYEYLCSNEFKQRIEAIVEAFTCMKTDLDKEKRAMERIWSSREKQLENVIKNTSGMYGDLQGLIGNSLPQVKMLDLPFELEG